MIFACGTCMVIEAEFVNAVAHMLRSGHVFQVTIAVVCLITVYVIDLIPLWAAAVKGSHNERVDIPSLNLAIPTETDEFIAAPIGGRGEHTSRRGPLPGHRSHNVTVVTYKVPPLITGDGLPFSIHGSSKRNSPLTIPECVCKRARQRAADWIVSVGNIRANTHLQTV